MTNEVAIISDIHGNLQALQAVLADIRERGITERVCLGDVVGYGANPAACVELVRSAGFHTVRGNHDAMVASDDEPQGVSDEVREVIAWTRSQFSAEQRAWLGALPLTLQADDYEGVHASLHQPAGWRYVLTPSEAALHFRHQRKPLCFIGHSHRPLMFVEGGDGPVPVTGPETVRSDRRQVVNVGSVGQPRDREPRACYVIYRRREKDVSWHRVAYDIAGAQNAISAARLPWRFATRLLEGR